MNAVISGRAAVALAIDGQQLYSIHYDAIDDCVERDLGEWSLLLGGVDDIEFVEDCDEDTVRDRLEDAVDRTEALDLVLYLLDGSLSDDVRRTASREINELLAYPEIVDYLEFILYAKPLPASADISGALRCCDVVAAPLLRLLDVLAEQQDSIRLVRYAFEAACSNTLADDQLRIVESVCLQTGTFAHFTQAGNDFNAIDQVRIDGLHDQELTRLMGSKILQTTLTAWANNLQELWRTHDSRDLSGANGEGPLGKTRKKRAGLDELRAKYSKGKKAATKSAAKNKRTAKKKTAAKRPAGKKATTKSKKTLARKK